MQKDIKQHNSITNMHKCMRKDPFLVELCKAFDISLDTLDEYILEISKQLDVDQATWGLKLFERDTDLGKNRSLDIESRRAAVKARWRSNGKVDLELIQEVADAWGKGVLVEFREDGKIHLTFTNIFGPPDDLEPLLASLDDVKPAHLEIFLNYLYLLVKHVHGLKIKDMENTKIKEYYLGLREDETNEKAATT